MAQILFGLIATETLEAAPFGKGKHRRKAVRRKPKGTPEARRKLRCMKIKKALKHLPLLIKKETDATKKKVRMRRLGELKEMAKTVCAPAKKD